LGDYVKLNYVRMGGGRPLSLDDPPSAPGMEKTRSAFNKKSANWLRVTARILSGSNPRRIPNPTLERFFLRVWQLRQVEGPLRLDPQVMKAFLSAPYDLLPDFQGPPGSKLRADGAKTTRATGASSMPLPKPTKPDTVVEVGPMRGNGDRLGQGPQENGSGKLISVDNDTYSAMTLSRPLRSGPRKVE